MIILSLSWELNNTYYKNLHHKSFILPQNYYLLTKCVNVTIFTYFFITLAINK